MLLLPTVLVRNTPLSLTLCVFCALVGLMLNANKNSITIFTKESNFFIVINLKRFKVYFLLPTKPFRIFAISAHLMIQRYKPKHLKNNYTFSSFFHSNILNINVYYFVSQIFISFYMKKSDNELLHCRYVFDMGKSPRVILFLLL